MNVWEIEVCSYADKVGKEQLRRDDWEPFAVDRGFIYYRRRVWVENDVS